jgi:hypothetical protein
MSNNESAEELVTKLNTYKEQLAQVQELIKTDPNNESFFKLRDDLLEVVALTQDLVRFFFFFWGGVGGELAYFVGKHSDWPREFRWPTNGRPNS